MYVEKKTRKKNSNGPGLGAPGVLDTAQQAEVDDCCSVPDERGTGLLEGEGGGHDL